MSLRLGRIAVLTALLAGPDAIGSAQTPSAGAQTLDAILNPGMTVWVTDSTGREARTRVVSVSGGVLTVADGANTRRLDTTDVVRVRARRADALWNGALIGAAAAVATGLFLCNLTEPWENCRDDVGPIVRIGAVGAGIGIGVDALIRGRKTIYAGTAGAPVGARRSLRRPSRRRVAALLQLLASRRARVGPGYGRRVTTCPADVTAQQLVERRHVLVHGRAQLRELGLQPLLQQLGHFQVLIGGPEVAARRCRWPGS